MERAKTNSGAMELGANGETISKLHNSSFINRHWNLHPSAYILYTQEGGGVARAHIKATLSFSLTLFDSTEAYLFFSCLIFHEMRLQRDAWKWSLLENKSHIPFTLYFTIYSDMQQRPTNQNQKNSDWKEKYQFFNSETNVLIQFTFFCLLNSILNFSFSSSSSLHPLLSVYCSH